MDIGSRSRTRSGRVVGLMLFVHLGAALMAPFILLDRVRGEAGLMAGAAASPGTVRTAVMMLFAGSALAIAISVAGFPVFRRHGSAAATWLLALAVAAFTLQAVDNGALLSILSLSQQSALEGAAKAELYETIGFAIGSARKWAHYSSLLVVGIWILVLQATLYRFRLVPRALATFGIVGSLLQISAVTVRSLLGYAPMTLLAVPLAPAYVAVAVWLMARGFSERPRPRHAGVDVPALAGMQGAR